MIRPREEEAELARSVMHRSGAGRRPKSFTTTIRHLLGGDVEAVPNVDQGDRDNQGRERRLVVVPSSLVPYLVRYRVRPITEPGDGLGECQRSAFSIGEVGRIPPGSHFE